MGIRIIIIVGMMISVLSCTSKKEERMSPETDIPDKRTLETGNLLRALSGVSEYGVMFGHQDATLYGIGWEGDSGRSDVHSITGDYPAVIGFDIGKIELGSDINIDNVSFEKIRKEIIQQYERGGIVTVSWHMDNPLTGGDSWDTGQAGVVASVLPDGEKHTLFLKWLESAANFFLSLKTDNGTLIPVLFRPWHEHTGSWFWWGKEHCSVEEYKQLWYMIREFMDNRGVCNLLYAYSPDAQGAGDIYMERYPGDEWIDLLGLDCYHRDNEEGIAFYQQTLHTILSFMVEESNKRNKPIALTETGLEAIPLSNWWTDVLFSVLDQYPVAYVMVWRNARERPNHFYAPYPGQLSEEDFKEFYRFPGTLFCNDIQRNNIYNR